jgi:low temperature requirement protein LtrA
VPHDSEPNDDISPLELFFDLVFVFAVSQLSHHLLAHVTWRGTAETLVLLLAVFAVWWYTTWAAVIGPLDQPRTRWMVLTVMLLGLFMNALGETVLTTGTAIAAAPMTLMTAVTGTAAMAGVVALWTLGFGRAGHLVLRHVDATADPVRATRHAGDALLVGVAGLIAVIGAPTERRCSIPSSNGRPAPVPVASHAARSANRRPASSPRSLP